MRWFVAAVLVAMFAGWMWLLGSAEEPGERPIPERVQVSVASAAVVAEVVRTQADQTRGLSGRRELPAGTGMLFVYNEPGSRTFWMPDMHFSIDIIWFDVAKRVVHIEHAVSPDTYPETFTSRTPAQYVLEVPAGWAKEQGAQVGDQAIW